MSALPGSAPAAPTILTPDRRLRVFVSSTLEELAEERDTVRAAIESLRLVPVMFEMGARPHAPRHLYRSYLAQSDVVVAVYWQRYGWVAPGETVSGLEDEYLLSDGKPRLVYIKHPAPDRDAALSEMLARLRDSDTMSYKRFGAAAELAQLVADDLAVLLSEAFQTDVPEAAPIVVAPALPADPTAFVGRADELTELTELVLSPDTRLVTLTGPGGIGKTRLALQTARQLQDRFPDGVYLALLAESRDPGELPAVLGRALGLRDLGPQPALDLVKSRLADRTALLVLDNVEHMLSATDVIADVIAAAPRLTVLATSRQALRLRAEYEFVVPPLAGGDEGMTAAEQMHVDAVRLFEGRVRAVRRDFRLDDANVSTIAEICRELDGVPLAIELAAARARVLPVEALLDRLQSRLDFLVDGPRDLPDRQRTLRSTIDWSYGLLDDAERRGFARLSAFTGSFNLEAVDAVLGDEEPDTLAMVTSIADKSLLQTQQSRAGGVRFRMLTMIREYAAERLDESGESEEIGRRHACYYRDLAVAADRGLRGPQQRAWLRRLGRPTGGAGDLGNIRAALRWFIAHRQMEDASVLVWAFWLAAWMGGGLDETRRTVRTALAVDAPASDQARARLLTVLGMLSVWKGDEVGAMPTLAEALRLARSVGDEDLVAHALLVTSLVHAGDGDLGTGLACIAESLELFERGDNAWGQATARVILGWTHVATEQHPPDPGEFEETLALARRAGDDLMLAMAEDNLAEHYLHNGDTERTGPLFAAALEGFRSLESTYTAAYCIDGIARRALLLGRPAPAALLLAASDSLRAEIAAPIWSSAGPRHASLVERVRVGLDSAEFEAAWSEGRRMRFHQAMDAAAAELTRPAGE